MLNLAAQQKAGTCIFFSDWVCLASSQLYLHPSPKQTRHWNLVQTLGSSQATKLRDHDRVQRDSITRRIKTIFSHLTSRPEPPCPPPPTSAIPSSHLSKTPALALQSAFPPPLSSPTPPSSREPIPLLCAPRAWYIRALASSLRQAPSMSASAASSRSARMSAPSHRPQDLCLRNKRVRATLGQVMVYC